MCVCLCVCVQDACVESYKALKLKANIRYFIIILLAIKNFTKINNN